MPAKLNPRHGPVEPPEAHDVVSFAVLCYYEKGA